MNELLVSLNGVAYGSGIVSDVDEIASLANGALAAFDSNGTLINGGAPVVTTEKVYFALGRTSTEAIITQLINRKTLSYNKQVYVAPTTKIIVHGDDGTTGNELVIGTITTGDVYGYMVIDLSKRWEDTSRQKSYYYTVKAGDALANILTGLAAAINADTYRVVNAVVINTNDGMRFTSRTAGKDFDINLLEKMSTNVTGFIVKSADQNVAGAVSHALLNGTYYDATTTPTLATVYGHTPLLLVVGNNPGEGTSAQILEYELKAWVERGYNPGLAVDNYWSETSRVVDGATYTQYLLEWRDDIQGYSSSNGIPPKQTLIIAVPSGDAAIIAALDLILAAL